MCVTYVADFSETQLFLEQMTEQQQENALQPNNSNNSNNANEPTDVQLSSTS